MKKSTKIIIQIILVMVLIAFGVTGLMALNAIKPPMEKKKPPVAMPLARTIVVHTENIRVPIEAHGIVYPLQEIQLIPQVGGKVIFMSSAMVDGGQYKKGDILFKIDPADYRIAVLEGDGVGPEVVAEALRVLEAAGGPVLQYEHHPCGANCFLD
jgi:multidrug efflux pump subunit AcrA (membrane-fusion protein)